MKKSIKISLLLIFIGIAIWMGVEMLIRNSAKLLWGYRPLFLFISLWGILVVLLQSRFTKNPEKNRLLWLSTFSGLLLSLGFPGLIPMPLLMFAGFVPLLMVEKIIAQHRAAPSKWEVFKFAFHAFIVWNILTTYWVTNTALLAGIFAIVVNSFLMCIPFVLFHQTKKIMPRLGYPSLVVYWMSFEFMHLNWELSWPWLTLGNSFAEFPSWVQWFEYTGVFGGSLWVLVVNVLIFKAWQKYRGRFELAVKKSLAGIIALIALPIGWSLVMYYGYLEKGDTIEVVVVQPNYEPHHEKFAVKEPQQLDRFLELSAQKVDENTDYLVFPETSFGYVETHQMDQYLTFNRIREFMQAYPGLKLITGLNAYRDFEEGETLSDAVRERINGKGDTIYYEIYNAAVQISERGVEGPVYRKSKLVPGPEIFPFKKILFFLEPLVKKLEGTVAGVGTQPERSVMNSSRARIAPVICYESIYGEYHNGYIKKGAQAIFIMTNDGWWDNTAGHRQHLHFASLRAIETRRGIARSANTGISAFINQRGDILQPTKYGEAAAIKGSLHLNDAITFYVRWGDIIARLALFLTAIFLLNTFVKGIVKKGNDVHKQNG